MNHSVSTYANATENVAIRSREELNTTYLEVGDNDPLDYLDLILSVRGTGAERAEFLRRLITAAATEVGQLEPSCSTCSGSGLVDWAPHQQRSTDSDQQVCPDCNNQTLAVSSA